MASSSSSSSVALTTFCILMLEIICSSGASLGCSYGSAQVKILSRSVLLNEQQNVYLFLKPFRSSRSCRARQLAGEFVNGVVVPSLRLNVSAVVVTADERQLGALHCTLESVQSTLAAAGLDRSVKVSPELSLPSLRAMARSHRGKKHWRRVVEFVRRSGSFVLVEMGTEGKGGLAVAEVIQHAVDDVAAAFDEDVGVVFRLKSSETLMTRLIGDAVRGKRLMGVLAEVSSPRRELAAARTTAHDVFAPVTNPTTMPATNPVTVPATNPAMNPVTPGIVTVPSTNPATGYSNNPNLPPLYPEPTPVTMPDPTTTTTPTPFMNPVTAPTMPSPVTNPTTPVTNPATTPAVTNPTTTPYPYPQQGGMPTTPIYQPPATMPGTVQPAAPTVAGQTWCVAKTGLMDAVLQNGLDYACGIGGADCSAIQPMGSCYNPNTMQAHASYAFNSYFQRNPSPASCDFGGAGMLVNTNPSSGTCMFQTSAGYGAGYSPGVSGTVPVGGAGVTPMGPAVGGVTPMGPAVGGVTPMGPAAGGGSGSTVLNANSPGGGNSMYGSDNPTSLSGGAASLSCGWVLCLIWIFTFAYVKEKV
ncbi:glucan endo-1,3-beta-glucosidase 12-like [Oryza brachyantha]|uniref:glucan endo-1,3-beta-glucosidase 12-like n=1 Tax=Oryza brachyantha TaxID=4533 RepID=UPI001ADB83E6|nr:glucan endo-1,3-beta-glucosidase 12-like [Oryza brachyantha]